MIDYSALVWLCGAIILEVYCSYLILRDYRFLYNLRTHKSVYLFVLVIIAFLINTYVVLLNLTKVFPKQLKPPTAIVVTALIVLDCVLVGWMLQSVSKRRRNKNP
jgi:undecaprenyl pyrophosphate phosphatase UppP